jgi:single-stranded-DNA-specific exonuclease
MGQQVDRHWIIAPPHPERDALARNARIAPLLAQLFLNRGIRCATEISTFLAPQFRELLPPEALPGAADAGRLLAEAARAGRKIVIYGDYDVDGITASAILWHGLRLAGANVDFYVPSRFEEGYGLNAEALEKLAADGAQVVVTVDCGITAVG